MRPEISDPLANRVNAVAEQEGYATGPELVRDAIRRYLDQIESRVSDRKLREWLERERELEIAWSDKFPVAKYDSETEETEIIEDVDLSILVNANGIPVYIQRTWNWHPVKIQSTVPKPLLSDDWRSHLINSSGYPVFLNDDLDPQESVNFADRVGLAKQISQEEIGRAEYLNAIHGIARTLQLVIEGEPAFETILEGP